MLFLADFWQRCLTAAAAVTPQLLYINATHALGVSWQQLKHGVLLFGHCTNSCLTGCLSLTESFSRSKGGTSHLTGVHALAAEADWLCLFTGSCVLAVLCEALLVTVGTVVVFTGTNSSFAAPEPSL